MRIPIDSFSQSRCHMVWSAKLSSIVISHWDVNCKRLDGWEKQTWKYSEGSDYLFFGIKEGKKIAVLEDQ